MTCAQVRAIPCNDSTWRELLDEVTRRLGEAGNDNPTQEARWLVERAGGFDAAALQLALDQPATEDREAFLRDMVDRRVAGEPLQHVLGRWAFRILELYVDQRVLIPRPETEVLVDAALSECDRIDARLTADLGTGSGAIALSLAAERNGLDVWATDVSADALAVAHASAAELGPVAARVRFAEGSWFQALPEELRGRLDVIVSNPPYVADDELAELPEEVRVWEPETALLAGPSGLDHIAAIVADAPSWLARPGALLLEMAPHQAQEVRTLARCAGFPAVSVWPDLAGRDRILHARL